jgi:hypothetical protein
VFAVPLSAQTWSELRLRDERVLKEVKFVSQSPDSILVKHSEGLTQVKKELLPAELQAAYPLDRKSAQTRDAELADARAELLRQKAIADRRAQAAYESRKERERAVDAKLAALRIEREAALQELRNSGKLSGDLQIVSINDRLSSAIVHVKNIGETSATFDWRQIEAQTRYGEKIAATAAMPKDKDRLDWVIEPQTTRVFEIGFGTYNWGTGNWVSTVRWKR